VRYLLALLLCLLGFYLVFDRFAHGFSWGVLCALLAAFTAAHWVKPAPRQEHSSDWLEALDWRVDCPFRLFASGLRSLGRAHDDFD